MARGSSNGFGSIGSAFQFAVNVNRAARHFVTRPVQSIVRSHKTLLLLLSMCLLACWLAPLALAQDDDVHITPREAKKTGCGDELIPAASPILLCERTPSR